MTSRFSSSHLKILTWNIIISWIKIAPVPIYRFNQAALHWKYFFLLFIQCANEFIEFIFYLLSYFNFIRVCKIFSLLVAIIERKYLWNSFAIFSSNIISFSCGLLSGCCILRLPGLWLRYVLCLLCRLSGRCISGFRKDRIGIIFRWNITYIRRIVLFILRVTAWAVSFDFFTLRYPFSSK